MWSLTDNCPLSVAGEYSAGALGALHDFAVILAPQPIIWGLQMPLKRKLGVSAVFLVGLV